MPTFDKLLSRDDLIEWVGLSDFGAHGPAASRATRPGRLVDAIIYGRRMNKSVVAWIVAAVCALAVVVDVAIRPVHWERTLAVAVVIGVVAAFYAMKQGGPALT